MTQVVGLALCAVGNLATPDMARDLAMEVDKHLKAGSSSNIRKKAALCTVRTVRACLAGVLYEYHHPWAPVSYTHLTLPTKA